MKLTKHKINELIHTLKELVTKYPQDEAMKISLMHYESLDEYDPNYSPINFK